MKAVFSFVYKDRNDPNAQGIEVTIEEYFARVKGSYLFISFWCRLESLFEDLFRYEPIKRNGFFNGGMPYKISRAAFSHQKCNRGRALKRPKLWKRSWCKEGGRVFVHAGYWRVFESTLKYIERRKKLSSLIHMHWYELICNLENRYAHWL